MSVALLHELYWVLKLLGWLLMWLLLLLLLRLALLPFMMLLFVADCENKGVAVVLLPL